MKCRLVGVRVHGLHGVCSNELCGGEGGDEVSEGSGQGVDHPRKWGVSSEVVVGLRGDRDASQDQQRDGDFMRTKWVTFRKSVLADSNVGWLVHWAVSSNAISWVFRGRDR